MRQSQYANISFNCLINDCPNTHNLGYILCNEHNLYCEKCNYPKYGNNCIHCIFPNCVNTISKTSKSNYTNFLCFTHNKYCLFVCMIIRLLI